MKATVKARYSLTTTMPIFRFENMLPRSSRQVTKYLDKKRISTTQHKCTSHTFSLMHDGFIIPLKAAYLHVLSDLAQSVGVAIAGLVNISTCCTDGLSPALSKHANIICDIISWGFSCLSCSSYSM